MGETPPTHVTTAQAADELGLDITTVRRLCQNGRLKGATQAFGRGDWMIPYPVVYLDRRTVGRPKEAAAPGS